MVLKRLTALLPLISIVLTTPTPPQADQVLPLSTKTIAQLSTVPTWLENIAIRSNGDLLITQLAPAPVLYTIKNPSLSNASLEQIYQWHEPNVTDSLGITETYPNTFVIVTGNATANATGYAGTFAVWEARFPSTVSSVPKVRKVANIPQAKFLNGIAALPTNPSIVLIPDSQFGLLFRLDTRTGKSEVIADRSEFKPHPERLNATVGFGINGIKIRDGYLYFSNSDLVTIYRIRITPNGYIAHTGKALVEIYADLKAVTIFVDDFTFGEDGTLWAASNLGNTIVAVSPGGESIQVVAGEEDQLTIASGTAVAFGRGKTDKKVLYVVTAGGLAKPVSGTIVEPGKVVAVETSGYTC
jgi:hypothetical protein